MLKQKISLRTHIVEFFEHDNGKYTGWELWGILQKKKIFFAPDSVGRICRRLVEDGELQSRDRDGTDYVEVFK